MAMPPYSNGIPEHPDDSKSTRVNALVRTTILVTLIATLAYGVAVVMSGSEAIAEALSRVSTGVILQAMLLVIVGYGWRFMRWDYFARHLGHRIPAGVHSLYYIAGLAFSATPGKAGEVVKSLYLRKHGIGYTQSVGMLVAERALDVVVMALLALLVLAWFQQYALWLAGTLAVLFLGLSVLVYVSGIRGPRALLERVPSALLRAMLEHLSATLASAGQLLGRRCLGLGIGFGVFAWGSEAVAFYMLAGAFGIELPLALAAGIYSLSILMGALSFLPGGIGGTEGAMSLMLVAAGADLSTTVALVLVIRTLTLWFAIALGLGAMAILRLKHNARLSI